MSAPPPDMLPGKPEDYYTRIPQRMGGTDDRIPWILARNILGALLFAGLAVHFNRAGNPTAALFCLTTAGALFAHSGRRRGKGGGPMDPGAAGLPISVAFLALGCAVPDDATTPAAVANYPHAAALGEAQVAVPRAKPAPETAPERAGAVLVDDVTHPRGVA